MSRTQARELTTAEHGDWQALVAGSPDGGIYSDPTYLAVLCEATGARFRIVGLFRNDQLQGGVALYERNGPGGRYVAPRLLLYYSGPVLARHATSYPSETTSRHVEALGVLAGHLSRMGYGSIVLKGTPSLVDVRPFLDAGWRARPAYSYVVQLGDLAKQWQRVEQNLRRLVKRCTERDGVTFVADGDFDAFWQLHEATLTRKGAALYLPKATFARYFAKLKERGMAQILHARLPNGAPIATQLVLTGPYAASHTVCAGGDPAHARLGAQAFLRWRSFEHLAAAGHTTNDLTDAALNSVTHFKSQLGGDLAVAHVLEAPMSPRFTAATMIGGLGQRGRGLAGGIVRRLAGRARS